MYGVWLIVIGSAILLTFWRRRKWQGRMAVGSGFILLSFIIGTWVEARAWTGVMGYIVMILASFLEVGFVDEG